MRLTIVPHVGRSFTKTPFCQRQQMQNTLATEYVPAIITGTVSAKNMGGPKVWRPSQLKKLGGRRPLRSPWYSCIYINAPGISIAIYNSRTNTITSNVTINLSNPNPNPNTYPIPTELTLTVTRTNDRKQCFC
jgi:hypothetical protein